MGVPYETIVVGDVGKAVPNSEPGVTATGYVDDLETVYDAVDICLNPVEEGSGSNIKLLEYLSRGMPTISTRFGARGTDARHGEHIIVSSLSTFPEKIAELYGNYQLMNEISLHAESLIRDRYTWESIGDRVYRELIPFCDPDTHIAVD